MTRHNVETNDVKVVTLEGAEQDRCSAESLLRHLRNRPRLLHFTAPFQKIAAARRSGSTLHSEDGAGNKVARQQSRRPVCLRRRRQSFPGPYVTPASDKSAAVGMELPKKRPFATWPSGCGGSLVVHAN